MLEILVNIDVPDLDRAIAFYTEAFGLTVGRKLGPTMAELSGATSRLYLLEKAAGTPASASALATRNYDRHWTSVHLDIVVADIDRALAVAVKAGAKPEGEVTTHVWGRLALLADPFGNGLCLLEFSSRGYDALTTPCG